MPMRWRRVWRRAPCSAKKSASIASFDRHARRVLWAEQHQQTCACTSRPPRRKERSITFCWRTARLASDTATFWPEMARSIRTADRGRAQGVLPGCSRAWRGRLCSSTRFSLSATSRGPVSASKTSHPRDDGDGAYAEAFTRLKPFTLVGATTRTGLLTKPLQERFGVTLRLDFYPVSDLEQIVSRSAKLLEIDCDRDGARALAERARGTPRIANRLVRRVRDFAQVEGRGYRPQDRRLSCDRLGSARRLAR